MVHSPEYPSNNAIRYSEHQIAPSGPLYLLAKNPGPGQSPNRLPGVTAEQWAAMPEAERFQRLYENGIQIFYSPAQRAKRTATYNAKRRCRRARARAQAEATN